VRIARARPEQVALAATLAAAAAARLSWLDLMEFKADEANACRLALHVLGYSQPGIGRFFPTAGLVSSVGIPNPPLFVYLVAVPLAIVRSPIAAAVAIAGANVLAIWLTYVAGTRCFGRFAGVTAAALLALSPWGIVFSRKIWAQDLLPLCTALFILQLHALCVERRGRAAFWLIVVAGAAVQLHFSACVLVAVLAVALVLCRRELDLRWVVSGAVVAAVMYAPYVAYHAGSILHGAHHARYVGPDFFHRLENALRDSGGIVGGGSMSYLIGSGSTLASMTSIVLGLLGPAGLILATRRERGGRAQLARLFVLWYALPLSILTALQIRPYMHYFIILLPLPYLGVAYVAGLAFAWRRPVALIALGLTLVSFALLDARFFRTIVDDGGAPGDYGIAYKYKQEAVKLVLRQAAGRPFLVGGRTLPYRFLFWNARPNATASRGKPSEAFFFVNRFVGKRNDLRVQASARTTLGPLTLIEVRRVLGQSSTRLPDDVHALR